MSNLNLSAKPFIPKSRNSYSEEEFLAVHNELKEEKEKIKHVEGQFSAFIQQMKTYVESVEKMKQDYTTQYNVVIIKNSALQDVRDVLYDQITALHVEIEKVKAKYKQTFEEKSALEIEIIKLKDIQKNLSLEITTVKESYHQKSNELMQFVQSFSGQNYNYNPQGQNGYYPYYYYPPHLPPHVMQ